MNAHAERFVCSIKSECLDQMIFVGQASLEHAVSEFVMHSHDERPHQGLANELVRETSPTGGAVVDMSERLGGLLKFYHRQAAEPFEFSDTTCWHLAESTAAADRMASESLSVLC